MDPRRGKGPSPRFAALLCWLLDLPPMTRPVITGVAVSGECVLVATDEDPFFNTPLGDWRDVERNLREWGAVCEAGGRDRRGAGAQGPGDGSMSGLDTLPPGFDRHADALAIVDSGACNPSGIALTLVHACRQAREEGDDARADPAVRLIATQLAFVLDANSDTGDYGALMAACRARAGTPPPIR